MSLSIYSRTSRSSPAPGFLSVSRDDESFRLFEINGGQSGCTWHFHPEFQLGFVQQGRGERVIGDSLHAIEPGEVVLLGPNLPHVWRYEDQSEGHSIDALAIHFREDFMGNDFLNKPELLDIKLLLSRARQGLQVLGKTREEVARQLSLLRQQAGFERLLTFLSILNTIAQSREVITLCSPLFQPVDAQVDMDRLKRVCEYIKANSHRHLDRDAAADIAHMSPSAFSRFFKAHTGLAFQDFVAEVRVGHACHLLIASPRSITDIALDCGFGDLSTFHRTFRKLRRMTPTQFRTRMHVLSQRGDTAYQ